eukprot:SAG11_NODE_2983_length_2792_cov_1.531006_3_plen_156_part_00
MQHKAVKMLAAAHSTALAELGPESPTTLEIESHFRRKEAALSTHDAQGSARRRGKMQSRRDNSVKQNATMTPSRPDPASDRWKIGQQSRTASPVLSPRRRRYGQSGGSAGPGSGGSGRPQSARTKTIYEARPFSAAASPRSRPVVARPCAHLELC